MLLLMKLLGWWVRLPARFCHLAAGVFFYPPRATKHEQRNSNLLSLSCFAPRFLLENFHLDKHVRYIVTVYPVVMLWMSGVLSNSSSHGSTVYIFSGSVMLHFLLPIWFFFLITLHTVHILYIILYINPPYPIFSFYHGYYHVSVCGTHRPGHLEALQTTALQRHWTQYVACRNSTDTRKTLFMNVSLELNSSFLHCCLYVCFFPRVEISVCRFVNCHVGQKYLNSCVNSAKIWKFKSKNVQMISPIKEKNLNIGCNCIICNTYVCMYECYFTFKEINYTEQMVGWK